MKKGKKRAIPHLRYYLERVLRDMGGDLDWAAKLKPRLLVWGKVCLQLELPCLQLAFSS